MKTLIVLIALVALAAVPVAGQGLVLNPTTIEWEPSLDHGVVLSDGTNVVVRYEVRIFMKGATAPFMVHDAGKPTPIAGKISITNPGWFILSAMNTEGFGKVAAIGPLGEGVSLPSNPFAFAGAPAATPAPVVRR